MYLLYLRIDWVVLLRPVRKSFIDRHKYIQVYEDNKIDNFTVNVVLVVFLIVICYPLCI